MANIKGIVIEGDKELEKKLLGLEKKVFNRVIKGATDRAMNPVLYAAKVNAFKIKDTGLLSESLSIKTKAYPRKQKVVSIVGPRQGFKRVVKRNVFYITTRHGGVSQKSVLANPANYAHLVEFGTQAHMLGGQSLTGAYHPGTEPKPFLRPAFDAKEKQILSLYRRWVSEGVIREAMKRA